MKRIIPLIFIIIFCFNSIAQDKPQIPKIYNTEKYGFEKIISIENKSANELFTTIKKFLVKRHADNEFIIETKNEELYDNGSFPATFEISNIQMTYTILYTISIKFKDEKIKIILTDLKVSTNAQGTTSEVPLENHFENMNSVTVGKKNAQKMNDSLTESIIEQSNKLIDDIINSVNIKEEW